MRAVAVAMLAAGILGCTDSEPAEEAKPVEDTAQDPDSPSFRETLSSLNACRRLVKDGIRPIPEDRADRFLGKVQEDTAACRGGERAVDYVRQGMPWVDRPGYWAAGDTSSRNARYDEGWAKRLAGRGFEALHLNPNIRGVDGALIDLEYERIELIKFNLFDNYTYETYMKGADGAPGTTVKVWKEMQLGPNHAQYASVCGATEQQACRGDLIRHRTLTGICNDVYNPLMGSTNTLFARNVEFTETFPDRGLSEITRNRHGDRINLTKPDPQVVSRKLFTRIQSEPDRCKLGLGLPEESAEAHCDYHAAPFFNVLAAYWIQFMTHDWFSHLSEGNNALTAPISAGCQNSSEAGCRSNDAYRPSLVAQDAPASTFEFRGGSHQKRAHRTFNNTVTAWWDASQIYGYDERSVTRVKRDPMDGAKLALTPLDAPARPGDEPGYLPRFAPRCNEASASDPCDQIHPAWADQETAAFPDNWTIGLSFYHNVFTREHNAFVDAFRARTKETPDADSGLRDPKTPDRVIPYGEVSHDELFEAARLVVSAEIAKIHTIEWTTQLLYDEPLYRAMNSNWNGLFEHSELVEEALAKVVQQLGDSPERKRANSAYSVLAAGPGIFGLGSKRFEGQSAFHSLIGNKKDVWTLRNLDHVNGGTNHFGSPFNFPEEFTTVYRLHPLVPDLLELRRLDSPNRITKKVPAVQAFRRGASDIMQRDGIADWALSMGRQRLGLLTLQNHGLFLQNLPVPHRGSPSGRLDIAALDLIRDRERGIPRFNEFRRQYGLKQLTSFDDFVNPTLPEASAERKRQQDIATTMRSVYGQHRCDVSKIISHAQRDEQGNFPNDCLGFADTTLVDNVEDIDTVVGWLAEPVRPHGYAISETQFVVFILNASRRLFSDRFFTSSYRPEFYTTMGHAWVRNNGPEPMMEKELSNGNEIPVSPMKRVLGRTIPALGRELEHVVNIFDPWARDRGEYYSLSWEPRADAKDDESFKD
jgi:hypothetical protein